MKFSILKTEEELRRWRNSQSRWINFVPTMGALHVGHKELIKAGKRFCKNEEPLVIVSIFVNPLQFAPTEDFATYPRNFETDYQLAANSGASAIWAPELDDVFPKGHESHFKIEVPKQLRSSLCGKFRSNHFNGVATVVSRLLALVRPQGLILGEKDWQQFVIIKELIKNLNLDLKLFSIPTIRDHDGLAYSSRNNYLTSIEREKALSFPKILNNATENFKAGKPLSLKDIESELNQNDLQVEYVETVHPFSLEPVKDNLDSCLLAAAVKCGETRLIDHAFLMKRNPIVAIDGPAGAGKSTVTKEFARKLGLIYLDTGAMYRAVTWLIKDSRVDPSDNKQILKVLEEFKLEIKQSQYNEQQVIINNKDVTVEIRSPEVTELVSIISKQRLVREALTKQQQDMGLNGGLVAEGRDIGTAVFPNAELKIFLTATSKERAQRRALDLKERGFHVPPLEELENEIKKRDAIDSNREISPLLKATDAIEVITDNMDIVEVVDTLIELFRLKVPEEVWPTPYS